MCVCDVFVDGPSFPTKTERVLMGGNLGDVMTSQPLKHDERRVGHFICLPIANSRSDRSRGRPLHTAEKSMIVGEVASWVAGQGRQMYFVKRSI